MWNSPCNDGNFPHGHALSPECTVRFFALLGVLQNDAAPMSIDESPFLDLLQGSEAAEAREVIVQAAISYARGLSGDVGITH
jgi:hypothetical protein